MNHQTKIQQQFATELDRNPMAAISQVSFGDEIVQPRGGNKDRRESYRLNAYVPGALSKAIKHVSVKKDLEEQYKWVTGNSDVNPCSSDSIVEVAIRRSTAVKNEDEEPICYPRMTAGFKESFNDSEIPDELDCKCEGGAISSNTRFEDTNMQQSLEFIKQDMGDQNISQFFQCQQQLSKMITDSDAYSPYGIVDDSLINQEPINAEQITIQLNSIMTQHKMPTNTSPVKNQLDLDGVKNITSAGTGHETISQLEGSLQQPCETQFNGVDNYFVAQQNRPQNLKVQAFTKHQTEQKSIERNQLSQSILSPSSYTESLIKEEAEAEMEYGSESDLSKMLKRTIGNKIDLIPISMQDHFIDLKCENEPLAQCLLDFLTEIRLYDQALFTLESTKPLMYKQMRSENQLITDLFQIKRKFIQEFQPLLQKSIENVTRIQKERQALMESKNLYGNINKIANLKKMQMTNLNCDQSQMQLYSQVLDDLKLIDQRIFIEQIVRQFIMKIREVERLRMQTEVRNAFDILKVNEQKEDCQDVNQQISELASTGVFGEKILGSINERVQQIGQTGNKSIHSHNRSLNIHEKSNNVTILGLLEELSSFETFTKSYEKVIQKQSEQMIQKNKVLMVNLTRQVEEKEQLINEFEKSKDSKSIELKSIQTQIAETNQNINEINEQIDSAQIEQERQKQLKFLELDHERIMQNMQEREERIRQKQKIIEKQQENEKVLKGQLVELERIRAENQRRFELGLLIEDDKASEEPVNPMFEERNKPIKMHAVNMNSREVKEIFASPPGVEEQLEEEVEEIYQTDKKVKAKGSEYKDSAKKSSHKHALSQEMKLDYIEQDVDYLDVEPAAPPNLHNQSKSQLFGQVQQTRYHRMIKTKPKVGQRHHRANSGDNFYSNKLLDRSTFTEKPTMFAQNQQKDKTSSLRINDDPKLRQLRLKEEDKIRRMIGIENVTNNIYESRKGGNQRGIGCCSPRNQQQPKYDNASCNPECSIF